MTKYTVSIRAIVTKTYEIHAESREKAVEEAHEIFTVASDDHDESYEQETVFVGP
jgi:hypothetical protein